MTLEGALVFVAMAFGVGIGSAVQAFWRDRVARRRSTAQKLLLLVAWPVLLPRYAKEDGEPERLARLPSWASTTVLAFSALTLLASGWAAGWLLTAKSAWCDIQSHAQAHLPDEAERDADTLARFARWAPTWYPTMRPVIADVLSREAAYRPIIQAMRAEAVGGRSKTTAAPPSEPSPRDFRSSK